MHKAIFKYGFTDNTCAICLTHEGHELRQLLSDEDSVQRKIFDGYRRMLAIRIAQPAFHPDAQQHVLKTAHKSLITLSRTSLDGSQQILVATNVGPAPVTLNSADFSGLEVKQDLLSGTLVENGQYEVAPHDIAWLV